ncbi:acyltransferase [Variovorax sp. J2P1-59]|uniref:acyltransferase family protein n=1 Tax=Variovorax flavidus TaxID=3053501 RepID=UPI002576A612|nr:acyltransferase [Variovorax sp. J2P1-59]MDM0073452.1 acyltransferase [Variovorax sp. J2P1-59]
MAHAPEQNYSIQILRAVAASTVAWLHTWTLPLFGLFGVDLFFVISGFVMCMVVDRRHAGPTAFLLDRLTRIVPLYWAVTTMVLLVAWRLPSVMGTTVANLGNYVQSLLFIPHFRDDGQLFPVLMVGWSLNFEMLFYGLITLVLAFGKLHVASLMTAALVSLYAIGALFDEETVGHEFLHNTLWFNFVLGMACFHVYQHPLLQRTPKPLALVLVLACYFGMVGYENQADRIWVAGVPSFLMLLFALQLEGPIRRAGSLILRFIVHIGDSSYATYLSHMFVIGFLERVVYVRLGIEENYATSLFSLASCLAVGSLIYRLVDRPLVRGARRMVKRFHVIRTAAS